MKIIRINLLFVFTLIFLLTESILGFTFSQSMSDTLKSKKSAVKDTLSIHTDSTVAKDTLRPIFQRRISSHDIPTNILTKRTLQRYDYRYTGGIVNYLPYGFLQDLGSHGQPGEVQFYGLGYGNVSFINDGIELNNRWQNTFNPYSLQMESIDTLELHSITSGFLFSPSNNPVVVSVLSRDKIEKQAYSKIRFYQAPDEEGLLDVMFSGYLFDRTNISFEATNRSIDPRGGTTDYNTALSSWVVNGKVHYLLSNTINLISTYRHERNQVGLFGGVYKSADMFDPKTADVKYNDRFLRTVKNEVNLKILSRIADFSRTDLNFYYQYNRNKFKQNFDGSNSLIPRIENYHITKTIGASINQKVKLPLFDLAVLGNYESVDLSSPLFSSDKIYKRYSIGGKADLDLLDAIKPSGYVKYLNFDDQSYFGFGGDVNIELFDNIKFFGGLAYFEKPHSIIGSEKLFTSSNRKEKIKTFQASFEHTGNIGNIFLSYFVLNNDAALIPFSSTSDSLLSSSVSEFKEFDITRQGINLTGNIHLWKILLEGNATYYFSLDDNKLYSIPELTFNGGMYYVDTLFQSNLYLKAGINYRFIGAKDYSVIDFEQSRSVFYQTDLVTGAIAPLELEYIPWSHQFDIFVAGTIQKKATVYFVFENLLDEQYYIVPYYPMNSPGIRLGISWEFLN